MSPFWFFNLFEEYNILEIVFHFLRLYRECEPEICKFIFASYSCYGFAVILPVLESPCLKNNLKQESLPWDLVLKIAELIPVKALQCGL